MKSHLGDEFLETFVEATQEYKNEGDANKQIALKEEAYERWISFLIIKNSNQGKYGSLVSGLISQYSMNNDQYPTTITGATDILS